MGRHVDNPRTSLFDERWRDLMVWIVRCGVVEWDGMGWDEMDWVRRLGPAACGGVERHLGRERDIGDLSHTVADGYSPFSRDRERHGRRGGQRKRLGELERASFERALPKVGARGGGVCGVECGMWCGV